MTVTSSLKDRIENPELLARVVPVEEAVKHVTDGCTLAISGFTRSGEPKTFLPALAWHLSQTAPQARLTLLTGASLSEDVEGPLAPFIGKRGPYMSSVKGYLDMAGAGDEPRTTDMQALNGWWRDYDTACRAFPRGG